MSNAEKNPRSSPRVSVPSAWVDRDGPGSPSRGGGGADAGFRHTTVRVPTLRLSSTSPAASPTATKVRRVLLIPVLIRPFFTTRASAVEQDAINPNGNRSPQDPGNRLP